MGKVIQVRDVPDDVHRKLTARAAERGMSLSEIVFEEIASFPARPPMHAVLDRLAGRESVRFSETPAEAIRAERAAHEVRREHGSR